MLNLTSCGSYLGFPILRDHPMIYHALFGFNQAPGFCELSSHFSTFRGLYKGYSYPGQFHDIHVFGEDFVFRYRLIRKYNGP